MAVQKEARNPAIAMRTSGPTSQPPRSRFASPTNTNPGAHRTRQVIIRLPPARSCRTGGGIIRGFNCLQNTVPTLTAGQTSGTIRRR